MSRASSEKGKKRANTGARFGGDFSGFVDIDLEDRHREDLEMFVQPGQVDLENFLESLVQAGYKFSLIADDAHSCCIATATGRSETCENKGFALSGRGPDFRSAMVVLWYKIDVICHWGEWAAEARPAAAQLKLW